MSEQMSAGVRLEVQPVPTKFARKSKTCDKYEYGHITINHADRSKDKYIVLGKCASIATAMKLNHMEAL